MDNKDCTKSNLPSDTKGINLRKTRVGIGSFLTLNRSKERLLNRSF
ncbi:hypothetical protein TRICHSKD4_2915 [Roseibium sp. TrichSKD4]|nr:hypothetical protein TRICHSKD4_2915 [Roseibium sp. TrichSKD4]